MSARVQSFTLTNPNHSRSLFLKRASTALCRPPPSPASLRFETLQPHRVTVVARAVSLKGFVLGLLPLHRLSFKNRSIFSFAASHEESGSLETEVEKVKSDLKVGAEASEEAWRETLASFKEQALKMQSVSQEAYVLYSRKAMVILKETSEQLKIHVEKARHDLSVIVKEVSEEGKEYLSTVAENPPEQVKDIVETFASSTYDVNEISKWRDFYLGIPYGILLSSGGFLSFMVTGSISAIRFGIILGGILLALSISSLRSWKRGESFPLALKGQAAIASILLVRELRLWFQKLSFANFCTAIISGAMVAFYLYRIRLDGELKKGSNLEPGTNK